MKHARSDYDRVQDPSGEIPEDEPVFLIRGQDVAAPSAVEHWANVAEAYGADERIVSQARLQADRMREWQDREHAKVPDAPTDS